MSSWQVIVFAAAIVFKCIALFNCEIALPCSSPVNLTSPSQTYNSVDLEWEPPISYTNDTSDNEDAISLEYIISFSPPAENSNCNNTCVTNDTRYTVTGLQFGVNYTFIVYANSTNGSSDNITVLVPGNVPPSVSSVSVCLQYSNKLTQLVIHALPCPLEVIESDTTPPISGYELSLNKSFSVIINPNMLCSEHVINVTEGLSYSVGATTINAVGPSTTTSSDIFYASWIRNVTFEHKSNQELYVHYKTASCIMHSRMRVQSSLSTGPFSSKTYTPNVDGKFEFFNVRKNEPLVITLQVVDENSNYVGQMERIELYPAVETPSTAPPTDAIPTEDFSMFSLRIIIGVVAGTVFLAMIMATALFFIVKKFRKRLKFRCGNEEFEYRTPKNNSRDPSTSRSLSISDDIYADMDTHKQNPACAWVPDYEEVVTNTSAL